MWIKTTNSISVSGARCSTMILFKKGNNCGENQVSWIKILLSNHIGKRAINAKKAMILTGIGIIVNWCHCRICYIPLCRLYFKELPSHLNQSTLYGNLMGGLLFNMFVKKKKK
jgi:hypothetical protein